MPGSSSPGDETLRRGRGWPAFETKIADARGSVGRFPRRERPRLDRGSRQQRIREERKLTTPHVIRGLVVVQHELHPRRQEREPLGPEGHRL